MGGGLELALHCHYRTLSSGAAAVAFPETFLGIVPAWGGTQLLPNLIGADKAVQVIIENPLNQNRMLKARQAYQLGIADTLLEPADFLEESLAWAAKVVGGEVTVERPEVDKGEAWDAALARGRAVADARLHGGAPAPYRALELMALGRTAPFAEGTAAEDEVNADLLMSEELRSGLYSFDLVQRRAKKPVGAPDKALARPVTKVGILGAGLMASQLALLFARRLQVPVVLTDLDQARVDKGVGYVYTEVDKLAGKGRVTADQANRLKALVTGSVDKAAFGDADFVIEAVFEDLAVKKQVFAEIEPLIKPDAILATNTSSLSITEMASGLEHPERVVGFHFFNPVAVLPLLEIVRAERTDDPTLATAFAVSKQLRKNSVLVSDSPAFVVNRLLTRFLGEVFRTVDEGTPIDVADRALEPLGLPMSPFVLLQFVGLPVAHHVSETLHAAFPDRFAVSDNLAKLVEAGKPGVYTWDATGKPSVDPEVLALIKVGDTVLTDERTLLAVPGFSNRNARRLTHTWLDALAAVRDTPDGQLPPATLPSDGPPPPHRWAERDPAAAERLARARAAVTAIATEHQLPTENLLTPDTVRRLAWEPPDPADEPAVRDFLVTHAARGWQVDLTATALTEALKPS
jgi:3-hydroxyacyl-CoA dehydrogenase/enoyl-CoA hydratase/carnithine racemase